MGRAASVLLCSFLGGLLGAAGRAAVVYVFWLRGAEEELSMMLLFVSAAIGFVVGIIAVLVAAPFRAALASAVLGAIVGAILAYGAAILTFLPLFWGSLLGLGGIQVMDEEAPIYGVAVAVSGAIAGGCGALLQSLLSSNPRDVP